MDSIDTRLDAFLEGAVNSAIALLITYGLHKFLVRTEDLDFALAAVGFTAFFTAYFTYTTGGLSYFTEK